MNLIDFVANTIVLYIISVVLLFLVACFVKPKAKIWDKILWPSLGLTIVLIIFGWICKTIGWDPLLW